MVTRGIRAYVARDWASARRAKDDYWAQRIAELGAAEGIRVADDLRREVLLLDARWPSEDDRREDLLAHVRLAERLRRAGPTCCG